MAGKKQIPRELSIYINDRQVINSLSGINREIGKVNSEMKNLNKNSETYDEDLKKLKDDLEELTKKQKAFKEEINDTADATKAFGDGFKKVLSGLSDFDPKMVQEGLKAMGESFVGMTKAAITFAFSPIGLLLTGLVAFFASSKAIFDYNKGLLEFNKQLKALGVNSKDLSDVRSEIMATAETFDKEFNEIAEKANSLSKSYGISMSAANDIIRRGLADGGAQNEEFLDSIGEYDEFFSKAGYSAKQFIDLINTGYDLGIYSDKLPDAIKEADLALRENTKSTRDALVNAFGASFSDDILNRVKKGSITTKEALDEIAKKAEAANLSQQQYAQLTADLFKGAGEDAGGAEKIFQAFTDAAVRNINTVANSQLKLVEANERLNKAQAGLFEIEGFGDMWTAIQIVAVETLADILEYIISIKSEIQPLIDLVGVVFATAWNIMKTNMSVAFDILGGFIKVYSTIIGAFVQFWKKIFQGDFVGAVRVAVDGVTNVLKHLGNIFIDVYNHIIDFIKGIVDVSKPLFKAIGIDVDNLQKKIDGLKSKKFEIKGAVKVERTEVTDAVVNKKTYGSGGGGATADALAAEEKARKQAEEKRRKEEERRKKEAEKAYQDQLKKAKELYDARVSLGKAELDYYIANNQSKIEKDGQLTQALIDEEKKRLENIKQQKLIQLGLETGSNEAIIAIKEQNNIALTEADYRYLTEKQNLENEFRNASKELEKNLEEQERARKAEQLKVDYEVRKANAVQEWELKRIEEDERYRQELADLDTQLKEKKITIDQYNALVEGANKVHARNNIIIARAERDAKWAEYGELFENIAKLLGENTAAGKAAALAQVAISQGLAIARIWENDSALPSPFDVVAKVTGTAVAVANVVAAAKQINSVKVPKFFFGGPTGNNPALGHDQYGKITGYVHDNEYVIPKFITQDPQFADTISWLEGHRQNRLRGYADGGETSSGVVQNQIGNFNSQSESLTMAIMGLTDLLNRGITAKTYIGYEEQQKMNDLNNDLDLSNQSGIL